MSGSRLPDIVLNRSVSDDAEGADAPNAFSHVSMDRREMVGIPRPSRAWERRARKETSDAPERRSLTAMGWPPY